MSHGESENNSGTTTTKVGKAGTSAVKDGKAESSAAKVGKHDLGQEPVSNKPCHGEAAKDLETTAATPSKVAGVIEKTKDLKVTAGEVLPTPDESSPQKKRPNLKVSMQKRKITKACPVKATLPKKPFGKDLTPRLKKTPRKRVTALSSSPSLSSSSSSLSTVRSPPSQSSEDCQITLSEGHFSPNYNEQENEGTEHIGHPTITSQSWNSVPQDGGGMEHIRLTTTSQSRNSVPQDSGGTEHEHPNTTSQGRINFPDVTSLIHDLIERPSPVASAVITLAKTQADTNNCLAHVAKKLEDLTPPCQDTSLNLQIKATLGDIRTELATINRGCVEERLSKALNTSGKEFTSTIQGMTDILSGSMNDLSTNIQTLLNPARGSKMSQGELDVWRMAGEFDVNWSIFQDNKVQAITARRPEPPHFSTLLDATHGLPSSQARAGPSHPSAPRRAASTMVPRDKSPLDRQFTTRAKRLFLCLHVAWVSSTAWHVQGWDFR